MTTPQPPASAEGTAPRDIGERDRNLLLSRIRDIPDWPSPGVVFKDITPLLRDADVFARTVDLLAEGAGEHGVDVVAAIEARGFILGAPVARQLGAGFVPIRKEGKLPSATSSVSYELEYGSATIEVHRDAFSAGERVLIIDDVLATGGTVRATVDLVRAAGAEVIGVDVLMELGFLSGRAKLGDVAVRTLLTV